VLPTSPTPRGQEINIINALKCHCQVVLSVATKNSKVGDGDNNQKKYIHMVEYSYPESMGTSSSEGSESIPLPFMQLQVRAIAIAIAIAVELLN